MTSSPPGATTTEKPPFLPYSRPCVDDDDIDAVVQVLRSDYLSTGPEVTRFERALAERLCVRFVAVVSSGTAALHAACFAAGIGAGDEVIVPAITFVATANCAHYMGASAVFADVCGDSGLLTAATVVPRITSKTRAIIPVHLTGTSVDMEPVAEAARRAGAILIEDAAHALGASYQGRPVGCCDFSKMAVLSFQPLKPITTGEGGAVVTNDVAVYNKVRSFRNHGLVHDAAYFEVPSLGPWYHEMQWLGHNLRLTDLQCALGTSQLRKLDQFLLRRQELATRYDRLLEGLPFVEPLTQGVWQSSSAWHLYVVRIDFVGARRRRVDVMTALMRLGVGTQVHYIPVPSQPYYRRLGWDPAAFPGALRYYDRALSLPLFPAMQDHDVDRVVAALREAMRT